MSQPFCDVVQAQFQQDASWIPDQANSIILINADRIFSSASATQENWAITGAGAYEQGLSIVPPNVGRVMLASQMDFKFLDPVWTVGFFSNMAAEFTLADLDWR